MIKKFHPLQIDIRRATPTAWLLLLSSCLLLWPVVGGIPGIPSRLLYIGLALTAIVASTAALDAALRQRDRLILTFSGFPWWFLLPLLGGLLVYGTTIPPLEAADEVIIALPGFTLVHSMARLIGWPLLLAGFLLLMSFVIFIVQRFTWKQVLFFPIICAAVALWISLSFTHLSLVLRYPPLVHIVEVASTLLTVGNPAFLRAPNVLWTLFLALGLWQLTPRWQPLQRFVTFIALSLGPVGWTYRIVLFQACGEVTLGLLTGLTLTTIINSEENKEKGHGGLLGVLLTLWVLERPSAVAVTCVTLIVLWGLRRREAALHATCVCFPPIVLWLLLSPLFTAQYDLGGRVAGGLLPTILRTSHNLSMAIASIPSNIHLITVIALCITSLLVLFKGTTADRTTLGIGWLLAIVNAAAQNAATVELYAGTARYNILIVIPLALGIGLVVASPFVANRIVGCLALAGLLLITPFDFVHYAQKLRATASDIQRTPTEGYFPTPLPLVVRRVLQSTKRPVILGMGMHFLDLFIAEGLISVSDRNAILEQSRSWNPSSMLRPVLIQAPIVTSYTPNLTAEQEDRLRAARSWALQQPSHTTKRLGLEETVIVP